MKNLAQWALVALMVVPGVVIALVGAVLGFVYQCGKIGWQHVDKGRWRR